MQYYILWPYLVADQIFPRRDFCVDFGGKKYNNEEKNKYMYICSEYENPPSTQILLKAAFLGGPDDVRFRRVVLK